MNKNTFSRSYTSNSRQISILGYVTSMREQTRYFHNKMTTDSDSECSYVANFVDFNVMRVIIRVTRVIIFVIRLYNCNMSNYSNKGKYSNNNYYFNNSNMSNYSNKSNYSNNNYYINNSKKSNNSNNSNCNSI